MSTRRAASFVALTLMASGLIAAACSDDDTTAATTTVTEETPMQRTAINPWPWSVELGFNQAELVDGARRTLHLAGQTAMSAEGVPQHEGDMAAQIELSLDNLETVLAEAGMTLADVVRMNIYTTDVDALFELYGIIAGRLGAAGVNPPGSLIGVARLAFPELMVELEATAQD